MSNINSGRDNGIELRAIQPRFISIPIAILSDLCTNLHNGLDYGHLTTAMV